MGKGKFALLAAISCCYFISKGQIVYGDDTFYKGINIVTHKNIDSLYKIIDAGGLDSYEFIRLRLDLRDRYSKNTSLGVCELVEAELNLVDSILYQIEKDRSIPVIVSLTEFPVNDLKVNQRMEAFWNDSIKLNNALDVISLIINYFKSRDEVIGYDFISEPVCVDCGKEPNVPEAWAEFHEQIFKILESTDSKKLLTYTIGPWGLVKGFSNFKPKEYLLSDRILFNFHFYYPHKYTHYKPNSSNYQMHYNEFLRGKKIDANYMDEVLLSVLAFKKNYRVNLFVGEYGVSVFHEDRIKYLYDLELILSTSEIAHAYYNLNGSYIWSGIKN